MHKVVDNEDVSPALKKYYLIKIDINIRRCFTIQFSLN